MASTLVPRYFGRPRLDHTIKVNFVTFQTVDQKTCSISMFYKKIWDLILQYILRMIFLRKIFLMLYSINWPHFTVWLPLLLDRLGNMSIAIICCPICDVINFENNHSFLIKSFFHINKKSEQKFDYLKNGKSF